MFASRLPGQIEPTDLARFIAERRHGLLDLTESNPTRAGFRYPARLILDGFQDRRMLEYDPDSLGLPAARELIGRLQSVDPDRVLLSASTSEAYSWIFKLLCNPGDEILVPRPSYPLFELLAGLESVEVRTYSLRYHEGWFIDMESLSASFSPKTRAVVTVNPNNPTGSYLKQAEWLQLTSFCSERSCALISDEVFGDYALREVPDRVSATRDGEALCFTLNGLSKLVGMPQMKLAWLVLSGPEHLRSAAKKRLEIIADTFLSVGTPVQYALPALLEARTHIQMQINERLRNNLAIARQALSGSAVTVLDVEAGWYIVMRVPSIKTEDEWMKLLIECGVLVQPGFFFDFEKDGFLVAGLLTAPHVFEPGIKLVADLFTNI